MSAAAQGRRSHPTPISFIAGTAEIQRNTIGEKVPGLPREPETTH